MARDDNGKPVPFARLPIERQAQAWRAKVAHSPLVTKSK